jgi:hypothetical protein
VGTPSVFSDWGDLRSGKSDHSQHVRGYNPTLTIEALAWRTAAGIARIHGSVPLDLVTAAGDKPTPVVEDWGVGRG